MLSLSLFYTHTHTHTHTHTYIYIYCGCTHNIKLLSTGTDTVNWFQILVYAGCMLNVANILGKDMYPPIPSHDYLCKFSNIYAKKIYLSW